jgi:hypothetical protein
MLAHATTPSGTVQELLFVAAGALGWIAFTRLRRRGFPRLPVAGAWGVAFVAALAIAAGIVVPSWMSPGYAKIRPHSPATIEILSPRPGAVVRGDRLEVEVKLLGGRITPITTTNVTPTTGHLHVSIDGQLLSMTSATSSMVDISDLGPGEHLLEADFVAADHGPFNPPVSATVAFRVEA